ncbi:MAG: hypothetical protein J6M15_08175 [Prevotella sp.]|nr:hypothetical protein [Prevotella sp.]
MSVVLDFLINHWEAMISVIALIVAIISLVANIIYNKKQSKQSINMQLLEIERRLSEARNNRERAIKNSQNHAGITGSIQEIGHYFDKRNEYESEIAFYDKEIQYLEIQKKNLLK